MLRGQDEKSLSEFSNFEALRRCLGLTAIPVACGRTSPGLKYLSMRPVQMWQSGKTRPYE